MLGMASRGTLAGAEGVMAQGIHSDEKGAFPSAGAAACPPSPLVLQPLYAALAPDKHLISLESNIS